jgi:hypothetical protein
MVVFLDTFGENMATGNTHSSTTKTTRKNSDPAPSEDTGDSYHSTEIMNY